MREERGGERYGNVRKRLGSDEKTAKNDNDKTRGRRKRVAQKGGRGGGETGPR